MVIYKTTNLVNGKYYIGQDSKNDPNYLGSGKLLKYAIEKYSIENFQKEILETCNTKEQLNEREIFWIKELNSIETGYNISEGGGGGNTRLGMGEEDYNKWIKNKSEAQTGKVGYWTGKKRPKHSEKLKGRSRPTPWLAGKPLSEDHKNKIAQSKVGKSRQKLTCPNCSKVGGPGNMQRWHFNNCKHLK